MSGGSYHLQRDPPDAVRWAGRTTPSRRKRSLTRVRSNHRVRSTAAHAGDKIALRRAKDDGDVERGLGLFTPPRKDFRPIARPTSNRPSRGSCRSEFAGRQNLPVARIIQEEAAETGDQSSNTRTSCPGRRNGSASASIVYASPKPSTAAPNRASVMAQKKEPSMPTTDTFP